MRALGSSGRKLSLGAVCLSMVAAAACGDPGFPPASQVVVDTGPLTFCCDPDAPFPQYAGQIHIENMSTKARLRFRLRDSTGIQVKDEGKLDEELLFVEQPGSKTIDVPVYQCGDQTYTLLLFSDPEQEEDVQVLDRCPAAVPDDPESSIGDSSLDLLLCEAAQSLSDQSWISCSTAGAWPPDAKLYSYYSTATLRTASGDLASCTFERHQGVDSQYCDIGSVEDFEVRNLIDGFAFVFEGSGAASSWSVDTGVAPTPTSQITGDHVEGLFDGDTLDPPAP